MDIIIAGAGRVGHLLSKALCVKHNVTVIDKNGDVLQVLNDSVDLLTITGDIEDPSTYAPLLNKSFDIFIAVTDSDEANLLSTLIADDVIDAKKKIIRLKNEYFAKSSISQKLGISDAVFPFSTTAVSIKALLDFPKANNVKEFLYTDFKLISVFVQNSDIVGETIEQFVQKDCIVVGIEREKTFFIPNSDEVLQEYDLLYLFGNDQVIKNFCEIIDTKMPKSITKITIFGASLLGIEIAKALADKNISLKVIEKDNDLCMKAAEILQDSATVINSRYIEHTIFDEEQISHSDMLISTDSKDEENIIRCLEAKEKGVTKTVAINNNKQHYELMHKLGIVAARGPKANAYYAILEKMGSSSLVFEKHYCGGRATIFMRKIFPNSSLNGKKVKPFLGEYTKCFIVREGIIHSFEEKFILQEDDLIFVYLQSNLEEKVKNWIYSL